ncbi:hypothetical protein ACFV16_00565 [Streptomyces massasporeus]|uniref:hypothetical protein n=1 Tax=Streptomyces massasporeus TaxID=67324 RepID=UPI0036B53AF4
MMRLRIQRATWPRNALILADTPRPDCPDCDGVGGTEHHYGDHETGEYAGTDWEPCHCSTDWRILLLPMPHLPRWLRRRTNHLDPWGPDSHSDEPPF